MKYTCDKGLNFQDCELAILRHAVDNAETIKKKQQVNTPEVKKILDIVETFIRKEKVVCYGGTAINNILPKDVQFYDYSIEIPDYDFFSSTPVKHAKQLADIYYAAGYLDVEAKAGVHFGTYKVFVNFIPVADITLLPSSLFESIYRESIVIDKIHYAPVNFLRMSMYLELSRPHGDTSRWEKVLKRLTLLNKHYLIEDVACDLKKFQRTLHSNSYDIQRTFTLIRDEFIRDGVIFFGGYATYMYSRYMPNKIAKLFSQTPDFDVISEEPEKTASMIVSKLKTSGYKRVRYVKHDCIHEIVPLHYEIRIESDTVAFIYEPLGCHNYNKVRIGNTVARIATIDTMLSFYLAFIYVNRPYYDPNRIVCIANFLYGVQQYNRLSQKGVLKRFGLDCKGNQATLETIRGEKSAKFNELKKGSKEYEEWFLKYSPVTLATNKEMKQMKSAMETTTKTRVRNRKLQSKKGRKTRKQKVSKQRLPFKIPFL